jgi:hypothetical protein
LWAAQFLFEGMCDAMVARLVFEAASKLVVAISWLLFEWLIWAADWPKAALYTDRQIF